MLLPLFKVSIRMAGDDKVGWDAVGPEFLEEFSRKRRRLLTLFQRLREASGTTNTTRRVRIWQEIRELDILPADHSFYVIAWELGWIASDRHQRLFAEVYEPQFRALYEANGVDYDDLDAEWTNAPPELDRLNAALGDDEERIREELYREFGEDEIADLWRNDRRSFDRRFRNGQEMVLPGLQERLEKMARGELDPEDVFKSDE